MGYCGNVSILVQRAEGFDAGEEESRERLDGVAVGALEKDTHEPRMCCRMTAGIRRGG